MFAHVFLRCCLWGNFTTQMSDTLLTSPSKTNLSSSSGTPMGPGRSAAACAKVRGRHQGLATGVVCDELCGGNEDEGEENRGDALERRSQRCRSRVEVVWINFAGSC